MGEKKKDQNKTVWKKKSLTCYINFSLIKNKTKKKRKKERKRKRKRKKKTK